MRASRYQHYLSLGPDIVAPDYYQLLGVERSQLDPATIETALQERLARLSGADDPAVATFLQHELEEARSTLSDAIRRDAYDQLLERQRLDELKKLVPAMLDDKTLSAASESVITSHATACGLGARRVASTVSDVLRECGAARGDKAAPTDDALAQAASTLRIALRPIADTQMEIAMAVMGLEAAPLKAEAPKPVPAPPPPPPTPPPAPRPATRRAVAEPLPPPSPPEPKPRPTTVARPTIKKQVVVEMDPATPEARTALEITELNERIAQLEKTKAIQASTLKDFEPEMEKMRRRLRRTGRSLASALAAALAFIAGHLLRLIPGLAEKIDAASARTREDIVVHESGMTVGLTAGVSALVLYGLLVLLAARQPKAGFLTPALLLVLSALLAGAVFIR